MYISSPEVISRTTHSTLTSTVKCRVFKTSVIHDSPDLVPLENTMDVIKVIASTDVSVSTSHDNMLCRMTDGVDDSLVNTLLKLSPLPNAQSDGEFG